MDKKLIVNNGNFTSGASYQDGAAPVNGDVIYLNNLTCVMNTATPVNVTFRNDANAGLGAAAGGNCTISIACTITCAVYQFSSATTILNLAMTAGLTVTANVDVNGTGSVSPVIQSGVGTAIVNFTNNTYSGSAYTFGQTAGTATIYGVVGNYRIANPTISGITSLTINADIANTVGATLATIVYAGTATNDKVTINGNIYSYSALITLITGITNSNIKINGNIEMMNATAVYGIATNCSIKFNAGGLIKLYDYSGNKRTLAEDLDPAPVNKVIVGTTYNHGTLSGTWADPTPANVLAPVPTGQTVGLLSLNSLQTTVAAALTAQVTSNTNTINQAALDAKVYIENNLPIVPVG